MEPTLDKPGEELSEVGLSFIEERIVDLEANPDEVTSVDEFITEFRRGLQGQSTRAKPFPTRLKI